MRVLITLLFASMSVLALASDDQAQKDFDKGMKEAKEAHDRLQAEKDREAMRDMSHDGRIGVGEGVSVGGKVGRDNVEVNVKIDTDKPDKPQ